MSNSLSVLKHMSVSYVEGSENWSKKNLLNCCCASVTADATATC